MPKTKQEYRLNWLAKQLNIRDKVDKMLLDLGVKSKTIDEQKQKVNLELSKIEQKNEDSDSSK